MSTKTDRFLAALQKGRNISVSQAMSRFDFESPGAVSSAVRNLRSEGFAIYENNGSYRIGTPSRAIVAAGYEVLGASALS